MWSPRFPAGRHCGDVPVPLRSTPPEHVAALRLVPDGRPAKDTCTITKLSARCGHRSDSTWRSEGSAQLLSEPLALHALTSQLGRGEFNVLGFLIYRRYSHASPLYRIRRDSGKAEFQSTHRTRSWPTSSCKIFAVLAFKPPRRTTSPAPSFARFRVAILGVGALLFFPRTKKILGREPEVGDDRTCVPQCIRPLFFSDLFNLLFEFFLLREQFFKCCHRYLISLELKGHCRGFLRKLST